MPFAPTDLSPTVLQDDQSSCFQDSGRATPAVADNDPVNSWSDRSGNGNHASQTAGGYNFTLKTNRVNGQKALTAAGHIRLDMAQSASLDAMQAGSYTLFWVYKTTQPLEVQTLLVRGATNDRQNYVLQGNTLGRITSTFSFEGLSLASGYNAVLYRFTLTGTNTGTEEWFVNGTKVAQQAGAVPANNTTANWMIGSDGTANNAFFGDLVVNAGFPAAISDANVTNLFTFYISRYALASSATLAWYLFQHGNSLTFGTGTSTGDDYPHLVTAAVPNIHPRVDAVAGRTTTQMISQTAANVTPYIDLTRFPSFHSIYHGWEATNELADNMAPATALANYQSLGSAQKSAGWPVVVLGTVLPRSSFLSGITAGQIETNRNTFNAALLADFNATAQTGVYKAKAGITYADYVVDYGGDAAIGSVSALSTAVYYDQTHLSATGYPYVSALQQKLLLRVTADNSTAITASGTLERGQAAQTITLVGSGVTFTSVAGSYSVTGTAGTATVTNAVAADATHCTLTVTAPTGLGNVAVTFGGVTSGTITVSDTTAPNSPAGLAFGTSTATYAFAFSWSAVAASPSGETITYDVKKNGSTVSSSQAGTSYAATGIVDGDVLGVDAKDDSGNTSTLATRTFTAPATGGSSTPARTFNGF